MLVVLWVMTGRHVMIAGVISPSGMMLDRIMVKVRC